MFTSSDRRSVYKTPLRPTQVKSARDAIEKLVVDAAEWFLEDLEQKRDDKNGSGRCCHRMEMVFVMQHKLIPVQPIRIGWSKFYCAITTARAEKSTDEEQL